MTVKTFWTIVIKILGIWLLFEFLGLFSQLIATLSYLFLPNNSDLNLIVSSLIISFIILAAYVIVTGLFIFKTSWIIDKLKLEQCIETETIQINLKSNTIITIAVIIIGGIVFINGFSMLSKSLYDYFVQKKLQNYNPTIGWIIFNSIKSLLGYLLITNSKIVVNYINKQSGIE